MIVQKDIIKEKDIEYLKEGFLRMSPRLTRIPVDIFINEDNMMDYTVFPIIVLFRNSYYPDSTDFMPMTVSDNPILLSNKKINIFLRDYYKIVEWVIRFKDLLIALSKEEITNTEFFDYYDYCNSTTAKSKTVNESISIDLHKPLLASYYAVNEMAMLSPSESGIRYIIWLDEDKAYLRRGHSYRIKVQPVTGEKSSRRFNELTLEGEWISDSGRYYSPKDKKAIIRFMEDNKELIKKLSDKEIDFKAFKKLFKKYSPNGEEEQKAVEEEPFKPVFSYDNDYDMVINLDGQYNIMTPDGELLNDEWFSFIDYTTKRDAHGEYIMCLGLNNERYKLYFDWRFVRV